MILVGGRGTRLRPLTSTVPKPVVQLVDRPFIAYMLEWLSGHGIDDVVMSCGFLADTVRDVLGDGSAFGLRLRYVEEPEPRGTAGAVKLAEPILEDRFLMLNGDVLTDIDLGAQIAQHEATGARATLALVKVPDPSSYGMVLLKDDQSVEAFIEKPSANGAAGSVDPSRTGGALISAGAYVLEREILDLVPPEGNVSIEREVWPRLVGEGLYGYASESYWMDIGTPQRYLEGTFDIIEGNVKTAVSERLSVGWARIAPDVELDGRVIPPAIVEAGAKIAAGAHVGPLVVLSENVTIGANSTVERAVILPGSQVAEGCELRDCIVGPRCQIGSGSKVTAGAVLGEGVSLGADNVITRGARIFPGVHLPDGAIEF
ncbi:MAG TPA: NDP-sugar synthase [Solirubrobacteraceae bacterium]